MHCSASATIPMKYRTKDRPEIGRAASTTDKNMLPSHTGSRYSARQLCIGDMEEELHNAFAMAR